MLIVETVPAKSVFPHDNMDPATVPHAWMSDLRFYQFTGSFS